MKNTFLKLTGTLFLITASPAQAVTIVLDFNDPTQANTARWNDSAEIITTFDITQYGFSDTSTNRNAITNSILNAVTADYNFDLGLATGNNALRGKQLDLSFEIGDLGSTPKSGDSEYYFIQIGKSTEAGESSLGRAWNSAIRMSNGNEGWGARSNIMGSVFTDKIVQLKTRNNDLDQITHLIAGTLSHEIGHTLSLDHLDYRSTWSTPDGLDPLMASGATGLPNSSRRADRQFTNANLQTLINATGTKAFSSVPEPSSTLLSALSLGCLLARRKRK